MLKRDWKSILDSTPPGLTYTQLAKRLGTPYATTRFSAIRLGYPTSDGRKYGQVKNRKFDPATADWNMSNVELARQYGVSRERIRFLRDSLGHPKVESRGRKKPQTT